MSVCFHYLFKVNCFISLIKELSSAAQFLLFMRDAAVFVKQEVLGEPEHDPSFHEILRVFLFPFCFEFHLTLNS